MSIIWILVAFIFGFIAKQITLPPLVGYLIAGFLLHASGVTPEPTLEMLADLGITLMLFTIGLKIDFRQLMRPQLWSGTFIHMSGWMILLLPLIILCTTTLSHSLFDLSLSQSAIIAFAFSFSSTVCVIKILEDNAELKSKHGDLAVGVLIWQDIAAVLFLFFATGKSPSLWAFSLLGLWFLRPLLKRMMASSGHGELIPLYGFLLALGGPELFELVDMKGDLGALVMGMLLAGLPKSNELYKSLMSFKDLFLICFFLSIGFTALPTLEMWLVALGLTILLPIKLLLFFFVFNAVGLRLRTSFLSALLLANYSEFGLIVASLSVDQNWLSHEWLVIIALSTTHSMVFSSIIYKFAHRIYANKKDAFSRFERPCDTSQQTFLPIKDKEVLIVGMGRVGKGAYHEAERDLPGKICGVELDPKRAQGFKEQGINIICGDGDDIEFWEQAPLSDIKLIMLALPSVNEMKNIIYQLKHTSYSGKISVIAQYEDQQKELMGLGADIAFNYYAEVGTGFAEESIHLLKGQ
ncbi:MULTISPECIES: cation:proton antiporter family protein [unclassified Oleiphilus]|jgi:predicted Kef-type K+ transport protein|uniref:cation:proton antiporter family protein n=8 Tax=Oleiphilus TaxID=141450 RepID=UPI000AB12DF6|nr:MULTISPECIES: cation:proton antiporter family protein [unclassified Oleiphilus]